MTPTLAGSGGRSRAWVSVEVMRRALLLALVGLGMCVPGVKARDIAQPAAWCWFADPRAVTFHGHAVFGWVDGQGDAMVGDDTGRRFRLHPRLQRDDHDNPAFYVRKDGRLMAFWTAHIGDRLYYRTARNLRSWGPTRLGPANPAPGGGFTYPNPRRMDGILYLFWSGVGSTATYATSRDDGRSWSTAKTLFTLDGPMVRYIKYARGRNGIHMTWVVGHPRNIISSVYHAIIRNGAIWKQDGRRIGTLGQPIPATSGDLVYNAATHGGAWIHDIAVKDGVPFIAYATFGMPANHVYRLAYWKKGWHNRAITAAGPAFPEVSGEEQYSGGISFDHHNPRRLYLSRKLAGQYEIEDWIRRHGRWHHRAVTRNSSVPNVRPYPVGHGVAWLHGRYPNFFTYLTALTWKRLR